MHVCCQPLNTQGLPVPAAWYWNFLFLLKGLVKSCGFSGCSVPPDTEEPD